LLLFLEDKYRSSTDLQVEDLQQIKTFNRSSRGISLDEEEEEEEEEED
jgi:hypothetical protein